MPPPARVSLVAATRLLVDPVLALVFPTRCPACQEILDRPTSGPLCEGCWLALPRHGAAVCPCGQVLFSASGPPCGRCRRGLAPFTRGASLGPYEGPLRAVIHELKYRGRRHAARRLARELAAQEAVRRAMSGADTLVPVPLHPRRLRQRGFNQAELLARELARCLGGAVAPGALVRRVDTAAQAGLTAAKRRANVRGAFACRRRALVAGRVVVLVDDVYTTGATARACAQVLREAGAKEVRVLTVARVR